MTTLLKPGLPIAATPNLFDAKPLHKKPDSNLTKMFLRRAALDGLDGFVRADGRVSWGRDAVALAKNHRRVTRVASHVNAVGNVFQQVQSGRREHAHARELKAGLTAQHRSAPTLRATHRQPP
eukprot:CAMPEP_0115882270 /NCGR_PEP_ID=MMETSP0287-20121206/28904_1 /TAXON_ID=412157 /ORGANISM="Chrysochromulina rotalis, Strain UIO044" /LENGTH=122 /DNA_ID=CAMNT_0003338315 /DNA_START=20 /DNA_END=384 /DNA_ORIENTATION=+